ncbi:MAG: asparagine synthetase B [Archaeoglobaceae archaeon]
MAIYAFAEFEKGRVARIYARAVYPSQQRGNVFFDCEEVPNLKHADELPRVVRKFFAVAAFRASHILLARDVLGGRPLYYGSDLSVSSFKGYIDGECFEVKPGEVLKVDYSGEVLEKKRFEFEDVFKPQRFELEEALEKIEEALLNVKPKHACIAFSGGLDSSLLAAIYDLPLIAVTAKKSDEEEIRRTAREIGKDVDVWLVSREDIEWAVGKVRSAIESDDKLQVSIGVPVYLAMHHAKNLGFTSIVFGQGADELFGGYKRYECMSGEELERALMEDLKSIGEKNLVRDAKIAYANEIRLVTPYLSWDVIEVAAGLDASYKVRKVDGKVVRKYALRKLAEDYLPVEIAWKPKKAIQYSTGIEKVVKKVLGG